MNRRRACGAVALGLAGAALRVGAQNAAPYRIAWVTSEPMSPVSKPLEAFRASLRDLGYVEGRDVTIQPWWGDGSSERLARMTGEIVGARPNVIVAQGGAATEPLIAAHVPVPIVFSVSADPVAAKFVQSFARPGGNATGISLFTLDLVGKRLELVKEVIPTATRVALLANPQHPGEPRERDAARTGAAKIGMDMRYFAVTSEAELDTALADIGRGREEVILAFADGFMMSYAGRIASFSARTRIPAVDGWAPFAREGNLMTYGPVFEDVYRRLAVYVDRIRKGASPADLPVELPTRMELVINLKVARALSLRIPEPLLLRADEVIR